jgi:hypothetical protein
MLNVVCLIILLWHKVKSQEREGSSGHNGLVALILELAGGRSKGLATDSAFSVEIPDGYPFVSAAELARSLGQRASGINLMLQGCDESSAIFVVC